MYNDDFHYVKGCINYPRYKNVTFKISDEFLNTIYSNNIINKNLILVVSEVHTYDSKKLSDGRSNDLFSPSKPPIFEVLINDDELQEELGIIIARNIREYFTKINKNQATISRELSINPSSISKIFTGSQPIPIEDIAFLIAKYNIPVTEVFKNTKKAINNGTLCIPEPPKTINSTYLRKIIESDHDVKSIKAIFKSINRLIEKVDDLADVDSILNECIKISEQTSVGEPASIGDDLRLMDLSDFLSLVKEKREHYTFDELKDCLNKLK
ncbi:helix-turn-helix domain-containing protein [Alkalihalobacillus sp. R86527]|uniref:helix-turn-helix domain-containing protein n=1 Tax=Alkalihalobacillus sp. R86527 TaxID=3093863 RepID=UPI00366F0CF8